MDDKIFYITRHGLATHSTNGYGDKVYTATLLPEGIPPIERMAEYLQTIPTDLNASSEVIRCRQTAALISKKTGKEFVFDSRLNEYWPGSPEPFPTFRDRIKSFIDEIKTKKEKRILIVTHGSGIAALKYYILTGNFEKINLPDYIPCGTLLIINGKRPNLIDFN